MPVTLLAPAKLTTSLRIVATRDDGYHLIEAEMVTVSLFDTLVVHDADATSVAIDGGSVIEDRLVTAALESVGRTARVEIDKSIPPGAGLGGGSADAAAILRWAGSTDLESAARIGADIAFCLVGGRARVSGIGEQVTPLPFEPMMFTLLTPDLHCSTPEIYRAWDELGGPEGDNGNDLEPAALHVVPELGYERDRLGDITGSQPRLAGSGSTWFVEGEYEGPGLTVVEALPA